MLRSQTSKSALACLLLYGSSGCDSTPPPAPSAYPPAPSGYPAAPGPDEDLGYEDDAGVDEPAQDDDAGGIEVPAVRPSGAACTTSPDDRAIVAETFVSPDDPLALSVRNEGAILSWAAYANGKRKVTPMWFSLSTPSVAESALTSIDSVQLEPASTATRQGFMTVWSDDQTGSYDLFARAIDADGQHASEAPVRLTQSDDDDRAPVVARGADENLLIAWRAEVASDQGRTLLLGADGQPQGGAHDIEGFGETLGQPALAQLDGGYVLAWVDAASQQVRMQLLDPDGAPVGTFARVDMDGGAAGHLALSTSSEGGALVFDVRVGGERPEVRFRAFDVSGKLLAVEQSLTKQEETGLSPSIIAFRGGYAVSYRSQTQGRAVLRVAFVDSLGGPVYALDVAELRDLNLPNALGVSPDGRRMFVAWTDRVENSGSYELRRAWVKCD